jgi:secreted trypsin-like serine protease
MSNHSHAISGKRRHVLLATALMATVSVASSVAFASMSPATPQSNLSTRIVGGTDVADGDNAFVVLLRNQHDSFRCGASLVAPTLLVTAAHCVPAVGKQGSAVVGRTDMTDTTHGAVHRFAGIFVHPDYKSGDAGSDLAFIELSEPVLGIKPLDIVPIQDVDALAGLPVTVAGWGALREGGSGPNRMQEVEVDVDTSARCAQAYPGQFDQVTMFCASRARKDSCQGDSGGPIFLKPADGAAPIQVGVVSWGYGCARPASPGVYTRLDSQELWDSLGSSQDAQRVRSLIGR